VARSEGDDRTQAHPGVEASGKIGHIYYQVFDPLAKRDPDDGSLAVFLDIEPAEIRVVIAQL